MAEQYQLPGPFQVPSMAEISYVAGNQQAVADANWKQFTDQITAYTNINNANRLQSLREKEFARQIVENDRKFDLLSEEQDALNRGRTIEFETNKYALDQRKKADLELENAWSNRGNFQGVIDSILPRGGEDPNFARALPTIFKQAKNPSDFVVINELLKPYLAQNKLYRDSDLFSQEIEVRQAIESNLIDVTPEEWVQLQELRGLDESLYRAKLGKYRSDAEIARQDRERQRHRLIGAEAAGTMEAEAIAKGATEFEITVDEKGNITRKAKTPRPVTGRTGAGGEGAGAKTFTSMAETFLDMSRKADERVKELDLAIQSETDEMKLESLKARRDNAAREAQDYNDRAVRFGRAAEGAVPQAGGQAPTAQGGLPVEAGARGVFGAPTIRGRKVGAPETTPTPAPAPTPAPTPATEAPAPSLESTLSPAARSVLGAARVGKQVAGAGVDFATSAVPVVGRAISAARTVPAILEGASTAVSVGRELTDYASAISRAEKAARARAAQGEDFQSALVEEQKKIIEELSRAKNPAVGATF